MKKALLLGLMLVFTLTIVLTGCTPKPPATSDPTPTPPPAPKAQYLSIATGGTAGVYFPLGGRMADILNNNIPGMTATAQSTGASVANINLIGTKEVEVAFVQNDIAYYAYTGTEMFADGKKVDSVRGLATVYNETVQIVASEASGIKTIADLKGKKVAVGASGSGTEANARQILAAFGITYDDFRPDYMGFGDAANNLKDGHIDAAFVTAGTPTAAVMEMSKTNRVVVVPIVGPETDKLIADYPFYAKVIIPANTYEGQTSDVNTVAVRAMIVVSAALDEALVYDVTKALFSNLASFGAVHARGKDLTLASSQDGMPIPLHPGADKFFKEK